MGKDYKSIQKVPGMNNEETRNEINKILNAEKQEIRQTGKYHKWAEMILSTILTIPDCVEKMVHL